MQVPIPLSTAIERERTKVATNFAWGAIPSDISEGDFIYEGDSYLGGATAVDVALYLLHNRPRFLALPERWSILMAARCTSTVLGRVVQ
jgi:hypothetical protein